MNRVLLKKPSSSSYLSPPRAVAVVFVAVVFGMVWADGTFVLSYLGDTLPPGVLGGPSCFGGVLCVVFDSSCILAACGFPDSLRFTAGDLSRWNAVWSKMRTILGDRLVAVYATWAGLGLLACRRVLGTSFFVVGIWFGGGPLGTFF